MPRGSRRRRGRRPKSAESRPQDQQASRATSPGRTGRRRRRSRPEARSALDSLAPPKPKTLKTLPPDGTVLEELISTMQSEYGTPATPQEYRLQIRVLPEEEGAPAALVETPIDPESKEVRRGRRSRRRGRRRRGPAVVGDEGNPAAGEAHDVSEPHAETVVPSVDPKEEEG